MAKIIFGLIVVMVMVMLLLIVNKITIIIFLNHSILASLAELRNEAVKEERTKIDTRLDKREWQQTFITFRKTRHI